MIADFEQFAGGSIEFSTDGRLKKITTSPEETPYLAEILREIYRIQNSLTSLEDQVVSISAEIRDIRNSTVVISGNDSQLKRNKHGSSDGQ